MGLRERIREAIEGPVRESERLLAELENANTETKLSILLSGWGRGLAAGLEELAIALDDRQQQRPGTTPVSAPRTATPERGTHKAPAGEEAAVADLSDASEEQLREEAKRSRAVTAEVEKETEAVRRELEQRRPNDASPTEESSPSARTPGSDD
jgi:hypothetical protein